MIVDELRRCYTFRTDHMFAWEVNVFIKSGAMLADFSVKSHRAFHTQKGAAANCDAVLGVLRLKQKGRALARPSSTEQPTRKSELLRVRRRRSRNSSGSSRSRNSGSSGSH